jgi:hypothetical protein
MTYSRLLVGGLLAVLVQVAANAQVYESEDAEGVPEFSDSPTPGAEVVDIPATNLMTSPEPESEPDAAPAPAQQAESAPVVGDTDAGEDQAIYYDGGDDENVRVQRREDADRIKHVIPGNADHGAHEAGGPR